MWLPPSGGRVGVVFYPVFLKLRGRRVLLVGGGAVAAAKLEGLLAAGAVVTVVAPDINAALERRDVTLHRRPFEPDDLDGAWWVVAAAPPEVNRQVQAAAEARRRHGGDIHWREGAGSGGSVTRGTGGMAASGRRSVDAGG